MCPLYVSGLIGPGDRKSVQPKAARLAPGDCDQLHHFIADGVWDAAPLESELLIQADRLVGGKDAVLVVDDTAMPKKGDRSVGVAPRGPSQRSPWRRSSRDGSRYALWLCAGGCRLRPQRAVPSGAHDTRACLRPWYPSSPGVSGRGKADLAGCRSGRPRKRHIPDILSMAAEGMLVGELGLTWIKAIALPPWILPRRKQI
jgi:hypothetical protein